MERPSFLFFYMMSRYWFMTLNNYTEDEIIELQSSVFKYCIMAKEVASTGTKHLHAMFEFTSNKRLSAMKKINMRADWEIRVGTQ